MMSRHSDEWKRVIATAALAGVTFTLMRCDVYYGKWFRPIWWATLPTGGNIEGPSKYAAAVKALRIMSGESWIEHN